MKEVLAIDVSMQHALAKTIGYAWILLLFNFFKESHKTLSNGYESVFVL